MLGYFFRYSKRLFRPIVLLDLVQRFMASGYLPRLSKLILRLVSGD